MHHDQTGFRFLQHVRINAVGARDLPVIRFVGEPLLLDAGHVKDVRVADRFVKVRLDRDLRAHVLEALDHFVGKSEARRRGEDHFAPEHRESVRERMDGSSVLQIPEQDDL